ncbi:MAG: hypothetical protein DMF69_00260 [Acidobacteria bacterium]|nr:MAG: hypothetical protein DMF69_00260 [Acidobacteriota bacterium]
MILQEPRKLKEYAVVTAMITTALLLSACAALQPPDVSGPRSNLPPYPIIANVPDRYEEASLAWKQLSQNYGLAQDTRGDLQPLTGTLRSVPANLVNSISLPRVGTGPIPTEEETRESLRRFIVEWRSVIGTDPSQLSLVERVDDPSGVKIARYEQRPFRYPLRGGFGNLVIKFRNDRRLVDISSNCLPNTERLQSAINGLTPKVTAETAATLVKGKSLTVPDATGQQRAFQLSPNDPVNVKQLVAYVMPSTDQQNLELHLAWEIDVANGPIKTIYLDAVTEQVIAVA